MLDILLLGVAHCQTDSHVKKCVYMIVYFTGVGIPDGVSPAGRVEICCDLLNPVTTLTILEGF